MEIQDTPPPLEELSAALRAIVRRGLPVSPAFADIRLLGLRGVVARSTDPHDRLSRVKALDELIARLLVHLRNDELGEPARILFGLAEGSRGSNLTTRRARAAAALERDVDHFRKHVEPQIVEAVAWDLHRDAQNYASRSGLPETPLEATGTTPTITRGDIASRDAAERAEAVSIMWSRVYALRAAVIRVERATTWPEQDHDPAALAVELHSALRDRAAAVEQARVAVQRVVDRYGSEIEHGAARFNPLGVLRLRSWLDDSALKSFTIEEDV